MSAKRLARIRFALCVGILTALGSESCGHNEASVIPPPATLSRQSLDEEVIETALVDLATNSDAESVDFRQEQGKGAIIFSGKCQEAVGTLRQELNSAESEKWNSLGRPELSAAREAGADIILRIDAGQFFAPFRPHNAHISLWQDDHASTRPADRFPRLGGPRPIYAAPPGYADQRRLAVAVFAFSWSMHGGNATYVLRFDGNKWNVISRHFAYYL